MRNTEIATCSVAEFQERSAEFLGRVVASGEPIMIVSDGLRQAALVQPLDLDLLEILKMRRAIAVRVEELDARSKDPAQGLTEEEETELGDLVIEDLYQERYERRTMA